MKQNVTLIGMPGAGKSTVGVILAKILSFSFVDTDILIQINRGKSLQQILDESGHLNLRKIEEEEILKINTVNHVIATGGSAVYSEKAMQHLQSISEIIFLQADYEEISKRIHNFKTRGIAKKKNQTFRELYDERQILYRRYAQVTLDCNRMDQDTIAELIAGKFQEKITEAVTPRHDAKKENQHGKE
ncbi:MAG: shikimate kinase [Pseudomonadota bacterium]